MSDIKILYVEDEPDFQLLVSRILRDAGMLVRVAGTGEEFWKMLKEERPTLLILDINLPDANGYEICRQLRQDPTWMDLPVLMVTVRRRPDEWLRGFESGADDYVSKPIFGPDLLERIRALLPGRNSRLERQGNSEYLLTQAALGGNRGAFDALIRQHKARLLQVVSSQVQRRAEAEDIVASVFERALAKLGQYRGQSAFYTWISSMALNEFIDKKRKEKCVPLLSLEELSSEQHDRLASPVNESELLDPEDSPELDLDLLETAFSHLPKEQRKILDWRYSRKMPYEEIAARLKIPQGTVMSRLFKARELLRECCRAIKMDDSNAG